MRYFVLFRRSLVVLVFLVKVLPGCVVRGRETELNVVDVPPSSENCLNPVMAEGHIQTSDSCRNNSSRVQERNNYDIDKEKSRDATKDGVLPSDMDTLDELDDFDEDDDEEYSLSLNTWSKPQLVYDRKQDSIKEVLTKTEEYMNTFLAEEISVGKYKCRNNDWQCSFWASQGDCDHDDDERREESK